MSISRSSFPQDSHTAERENGFARAAVECALVNGTAVRGSVYSFNRQFEESANRDLVLRSPIERRPALPENGRRDTAANGSPTAEWVSLDDFGYLVVNASQIAFMQVTHVPRGALDD
ncbi:DUF6338 family protein [Candidatus Poriferisodalis sp.]|uniref:DUF6338 family protein n=1 Tax=Candidatus Poriferisodalis sp. TaxID=3101277 RepID=UPI003D101832